MKTKNGNKMVVNDFNIENDILIAYFGNDKKVIVPNGIKIIDEIAFQYKENIEEIILPETVVEIRENAKILFDVIKNSSGSFEVNEIKSFLKKINCITLKAPSQDKSDIQIKIHDPLLSAEPTLGFSIKSQIGSPSTLLNASGTTNFLYEIVGDLSDDEIEEINSFRLFKDKFHYLENKNISLEFMKVDNDTFNNNLMLIESKMSFILSKILLYYYSGISSELKDLIEICSEKDICNTNRNNLFYEIKIKDFLMSVALGMKPGTSWNGLYEATGGYLIVKETGEILCYHIYNRNDLRDYLFNNTKLDTPSRTKHGFGNIYKEKGKLYLKLNLQIRFLK